MPCRKNFPHLVQMHNKYAKQGLVAVSVSVDDPTDKEAMAELGKFLRDNKATCTNFLLTDPPEVWQKKLKIEGVPAVFVFNRGGQIEQKYGEAPGHEEVEKLVERLLRRK
jgi:peroxiredoxin